MAAYKKKQGKFSKMLIISVFVLIIIYTTVVLVFSTFSWVVPDSLTMAFFAAMIGECSALGIIKSCKLKGKKGE